MGRYALKGKKTRIQAEPYSSFDTLTYIEPFYQGVSFGKMCQNTVFLWPVFYRVWSEFPILYLYEKVQVRENPYFGIFYAVYSNW